jgi:hypothetical protein
MALFSSAFLFLILFGAGLGIVGSRIPDMVRSGEMTVAGASLSVAAGTATFLFLAIFMAHHVLLFVHGFALRAASPPVHKGAK